jgi:hypothetical protein
VAGECAQHGYFFAAPPQLDLDLLAGADTQRAPVSFSRPDFVVIPGPKSRDLFNRAIDNYLDLFSIRRSLFLDQAIGLFHQVESALRLKLAMLLSTAQVGKAAVLPARLDELRGRSSAFDKDRHVEAAKARARALDR